MRGIRRKEKAITDEIEMREILTRAQYITIAMSVNNEPYLVTLSHGYDSKSNCIYFHCASEGKKVEILQQNNLVWGQALIDRGYVQGKCDHLFATTQFRGRVIFVTDMDEKYHALRVMIRALEDEPECVETEQLKEKSVARVHIGRIDIEFMTGKKTTEVVIQT